MSATPEQLRTMADMLDDPSGPRSYSEVWFEAIRGLPMPWVRYANMGGSTNEPVLIGMVSLWLRLEALRLEQDARRVPSDAADVLFDPDVGPVTYCGCPAYDAHVAGCDRERCGNCGGQRIACGCDDEEITDVVRAHWARMAPPPVVATP